jgi:hypothetical protein
LASWACFRLSQTHDIYAPDGNLRLHLAPKSIPGGDAYVIVAPPGAIPGPLPNGLTLIGEAYDVTASGALVAFDIPVTLRARYDPALLNPAAETPQLYRWNPGAERWENVPATPDAERHALVATVTRLGTYAVAAPVDSGSDVEILLPLIVR